MYRHPECFFESTSRIDLATLNAAVDTILPGASHAGAGHYIIAALNWDYQDFRDLYREGLVMLDRLARESYGRLFARLKQDQRISLFEQITDTEFFATIRQHTMEGMFADPIYGGNRGKLGWKLIGFPGARFHPITHLSQSWQASVFISLADRRRLREHER